MVPINENRTPPKELNQGPVRQADLMHGAKCASKNQPNLGEATTTRS